MGNSLSAICRLMVKGISSFPLMAVPFFITMIARQEQGAHGNAAGSGGIDNHVVAGGHHTLAIVMILIATSAVFGDCLTKLHVPDLAAQAIVGITDNR